MRDRTQVTNPIVYTKLESLTKGLIIGGMYWKLPELCKSDFHKSHTVSIKILNFVEKFSNMIIFKLEFSNYQSMNKAYVNMPYKKRSF